MTKEQLGKNQERDEHMAKMMTQLDLLTKNMMNRGLKTVNAIDAGKGNVSEDEKFETLYEEEVQYLSNQPGGSRPNYPRPGGNPNWNSNEGQREGSYPS